MTSRLRIALAASAAAVVSAALGLYLARRDCPLWRCGFNAADPVTATIKAASLAPAGPARDALVRALRADYCGTGIAGTVDGARVCHRPGGPPDSEVEAAWSPAGATCIGERTRGPVGCMLPRCLGGEPAFWTTATP